MHRVALRNIRDVRIDLEHLTELAHFGPGAFFDQLAFGGDGADLAAEVGWYKKYNYILGGALDASHDLYPVIRSHRRIWKADTISCMGRVSSSWQYRLLQRQWRCLNLDMRQSEPFLDFGF